MRGIDRRVWVAALVAGLVLAPGTGCEPLDPVDPGDALVEVWLTDAAAAYLEVAYVDIGGITLVARDGSTVPLTGDATAGPVDLMDLRAQNPMQVAEAEAAPGVYTQLRLAVESAEVELDAAYAFIDGTRTRQMTVPTEAQAGVSLNLDVAGVADDSVGALVVEAGRVVFMVDFDVNQSFLIQGDPEALEGIQGMTFLPALRVVVQSVAGSIAGTVSSQASEVGAAGRVVTARPIDEGVLGPYQSQTATATTSPDGSYTIPFLPAGRYIVDVDVPDGYTTNPVVTETQVDVSSDVTGVNFVVQADPGA